MYTRIFAAVLLAAWLVLLIQTSLLAEQTAVDIPAKRVAVMELRVSGDYSDQVRDWLPAMIEEELLKHGWTLVVRGERMRHIQEERSLPGVRPDTRVPDNELLGATAFLELSARIQVKDAQGIVGYKSLTLGDYARASVDINGQIIDPATGLLKSSITVGGSASGLKTAAVVSIAGDWRIGAGGYSLRGVRETLVGRAADVAVRRLVEKLGTLCSSIPGQNVPSNSPSKLTQPLNPLQPSSTTVAAVPVESTILIELPDATSAKVGDRYGVYRGGDLVAEVEIVRIAGKRAEAKVIRQSSPIEPTDIARKMPLIIKAE
ncbi:MAG: CsgG/HfaB family protein [Armatimonadota bacterium]|nr:CsgG/HfaB family protein [Armatimonadota bacterium]